MARQDSIRLDSSVIIPVLEPLREINHRLLDLLKSFTADDWSQPTVHSDRDVKDLTAHLLHGSLRRVTSMRDSYRRPTPAIASTDDLIAFIQADNRDFMEGMRRIIPNLKTSWICRELFGNIKKCQELYTARVLAY